MVDAKLAKHEVTQAHIRKLLVNATPRVIAALIDTALTSENAQLRFQAQKAILDFTVAKPKEAQKVDVSVTSTTASQLAALAARAQAGNILNTLPISEPSGKLPINHAPLIDAKAVPVTVDSVETDDSRNSADKR